MFTARKLAALAVVAAATIAACGGGGATAVSEPELISKGDELCRVGQEKFAEIQAKPASTVAEYADQTGELADAAQTVLDGLEDLKPPSELEAKYNAYLDSYREGVDLLRQGKKAAEDRAGTTFGKLQSEVEKTGPKRRELAEAVGFKECSKLSPKTSR